jgi:hypothetical protein
VRIRILSILSASAFYPFCPHPHFILFVRIRILSLLSVRPSVRLSVRVSVRIRVLSQPSMERKCGMETSRKTKATTSKEFKNGRSFIYLTSPLIIIMHSWRGHQGRSQT